MRMSLLRNDLCPNSTGNNSVSARKKILLKAKKFRPIIRPVFSSCFREFVCSTDFIFGKLSRVLMWRRLPGRGHGGRARQRRPQGPGAGVALGARKHCGLRRRSRGHHSVRRECGWLLRTLTQPDAPVPRWAIWIAFHINHTFVLWCIPHVGPKEGTVLWA